MSCLAGELALSADFKLRMKAQAIRTISQFAEDEIILPDGPYEGRRLRLSRSPAAKLLYKELESNRWRMAFITGPNQDGKSLFGFVIPTLYLLFERRETVVMGVKSLDMVGDKWRKNLLPVIQASSKFRELLPTSGSGSRGGDSAMIEFKNGASLRFMTAGGDDQSRAGFTTPNLVVTETDGFDEVGGKSREGDKFSQLVRRTLAFAERARIIAECTVSTESGITWRQIKRGSDSRIALRCPHCLSWVTPERKHLTGWKDAETSLLAARGTHLVCPDCGSVWTNEERIEANQNSLLIHKGQSVAPDGSILGDAPDTDVLGFRWTVVNSVLNAGRLGMVGAKEWEALRAADEEAAETDICQSEWAMPGKGASQAIDVFDYAKLMKRVMPGVGRGICPEDTELITVGTDINKFFMHWVAIAWRTGATPHVVDYGIQDVPSAMMAEEVAISGALRSLRDGTLNPGWSHKAGRLQPTLVFVDAGWQDETVHQFVSECLEGYFATKGFGSLQRRTGKSRRDGKWTVAKSGEKYSVLRALESRFLIEINVDFWKSWLFGRVTTPVGQTGALTLFDPLVTESGQVNPSAAAAEHLTYAKQMTSERRIDDWDPQEGSFVRWEAVTRKNHFLDATMLACVAGHAAGVRLIEAGKKELPAAPVEDDSVSASVGSFRGKW